MPRGNSRSGCWSPRPLCCCMTCAPYRPGVSRGQTYVVDKDITSRAEAQMVCEAVLDVLRPYLRRAHIDAVTDCPDEMEPEDRAALEALLAKGRLRSGWLVDPVMGIEVSVEDPEWGALERFAAWSIHVQLYGSAYVEQATFHDTGHSVIADLTADEASEVARRVESVGPLILLADKHHRGPAARGCLWPRRGGPPAHPDGAGKR